MAYKFDLFRLSLLPRVQLNIDNVFDTSRETYLRGVFSKKQKFTHFKNEFHYIPVEDGGERSEIIGRIGRSVVMHENRPPSDNLEDAKHETWKASIIVIDPTDHEDGQKISIQIDAQVGRTGAIMNSFIKALNDQNETTAYHIEIAPISEANTFWQFADQNSGNITTLEFTFVAPNMFGGKDNITKEMRRFRDEEKARKVKISMSSQDGLDTNTDNVKNAVDYATKGGGDIAAKVKGGEKFKSQNKAKSVIIDTEDSEDNKNGESLLDKVSRNITRILGRE